MKIQSREKIEIAGMSIVLWLGLGTLIFHYLEKWTWIQSFYFSVISVTTVGFGDLTPTSDLSRLVVSFYILFGVSIVLAALSVIGGHYLATREETYKTLINNKKE